MGAQNFNSAPKFHKKGDFSAPNFALFGIKFSDEKICFPTVQNLRVKGAITPPRAPCHVATAERDRREENGVKAGLIHHCVECDSCLLACSASLFSAGGATQWWMIGRRLQRLQCNDALLSAGALRLWSPTGSLAAAAAAHVQWRYITCKDSKIWRPLFRAQQHRRVEMRSIQVSPE